LEVTRYAADDSDEAQPLFRLTTAEADTVAEILAAPRIAERFADLTSEVIVPATSAHAARTSSPPDEVLHMGDVLVVIGTHGGITGMRRIIEG
jgi:TrkA domain protein